MDNNTNIEYKTKYTKKFCPGLLNLIYNKVWTLARNTD